MVIHRRVQWFDTDSSTKYHNTAPLRFMEEAEAVLLDRLGIVKAVYGRLPRRKVTVDYLRPLRFWDPVEVSLAVEAVGGSSVTYGFKIAAGGEVCAEGRVVAVLISDAGRPRRWPDEYRRLLERSGRLAGDGGPTG